MENIINNYTRSDRMPHIWCPGCGNGILMGALLRAIDQLGYHQDKVSVVSGIGCSSRAPGYLNFNTLHTTHGRALAFATGLKLARPELKIFVLMGDGDCTAIGGNHFIHSCRRNIDITAFIFNNNIYGMTGGQTSPTTPRLSRTTTSPYGAVEHPFDVMKLATAAGATYAARATAFHARLLEKFIIRGAQNKGFSVIEALTPCPVSYGRRNNLGSGQDMMQHYKENSLRVEKAASLSPEEREGKILIGEFYQAQAPEFTEELEKMAHQANR